MPRTLSLRARWEAATCWQTALIMGTALFVLSASANGQSEGQRHTTCESGISVSFGEPAELKESCAAWQEVTSYFRKLGFSDAGRVSISFTDRVLEPSPRLPPSHAYFDAAESRIVVYRSTPAKAWGLDWTPEIALSFLHHELVHRSISVILGPQSSKMRREWHEFFAYAIQFEMMQPTLRDRVLNHFPEIRAFSHLGEINEFTYGMNPEVFAVAAFKTYVARGGGVFVGSVLRDEVKLPAPSYPFPVLPDQIPPR